jgi:outer membrane protein assembly factor BamD (BamD/ComL family)
MSDDNYSKEEKVMNALDFLSDRVQDCSNTEIVNMVAGVLEDNFPEEKFTKKFISKVIDEQWY